MGILADGSRQLDADVFGSGGDMWGTLANTAVGGLMSGLGGKSKGPQSAQSTAYTNVNNSGWSVATSGSKADSASSMPWYVYALGAIVAIKFAQKMGK